MGTRKRQKQQTRERILQSARTLFEENGFAKTTLRDIGAAAGVTAGNIFVHFPNKDALMVAALAEEIDQLLAAAHASFPVDADLLVQLHHHPRQLLLAYCERRVLRDLIRRTFTLHADMGPLSGQAVVAVQYWAELVEAAKVRGTVHADTDADLFGKACWAYYWQSVTLVLRAEPPDSDQALDLNQALLTQLVAGHTN